MCVVCGRYLNIESFVDLSGGVRGVEAGHHLGGRVAGILGQRSGHDFEALGIFFDRILVEAGSRFSKRLKALRELNLRGAGSRDETVVAAKTLKHIDPVI